MEPLGRSPHDPVKNNMYTDEVACFAETSWGRAHGERDKADKLGPPLPGRLVKGRQRSAALWLQSRCDQTQDVEESAICGTLGGLISWMSLDPEDQLLSYSMSRPQARERGS